jgi:hypothetical protein
MQQIPLFWSDCPKRSGHWLEKTLAAHEHEPDLEYLLRGTRFTPFLQIDARGVQLPSWIATVNGIKPAMDLWVPRNNMAAFEAVTREAGLLYHLDCYFDRHSEVLKELSDECFTTTRAVLTQAPGRSAEAHVFVSRSERLLREAVATGWYPLVVNGTMVEKHLADNALFGRALGYPHCCITFFQKHNNWQADNHYYAAYRSSEDRPCWLANTLTRHTAFFLAPHIPCSFSCKSTASYAAELFSLIGKELPAYASEVQRTLRAPMLYLSELRIYAFEGKLQANKLSYSKVGPINPTRPTDDLYSLLMGGDECIVEANIVNILRRGRPAASYFARADRYGPEFPFLVQCE